MDGNGVRSGSSGGAFSIGAIVKGTTIAFVLTLFMSLILAVVVTLSNWPGDTSLIPWISYFSIVVGATFAAKKSKRIGWLHGIAVAIAYFMVSFLLFQGGSTFGEIAYGGGFLKVTMWSMAGAIGGIVGVDL